MSETFTDDLKEEYEKACESNKGQHQYYFCATSERTTARILNLNHPFVFCNRDYEQMEGKNNNLKEYKLAAYIVKEALKDQNGLLPIKGKRWKLLDAERKFAKADLCKRGDGQRLDLLAYDEDEQCYIVLELKVERDLMKKSNGAHSELLEYTGTMENNRTEANTIYSVEAQKVKGYIVWPGVKKPKKYDKPWGLIEYDKAKLDDNIETLTFAIIREPS